MNRFASRELSMLIALVAIWAFFAWQEPVFLSARNLSLLSVELAVTAVLALGMLVVLLPGAWRAMATAKVEGPTTLAVTVQPGDTLWGIAAAIDPGADPRALMAEIRELNGLVQSGLAPGQVLVVPAD